MTEPTSNIEPNCIVRLPYAAVLEALRVGPGQVFGVWYDHRSRAFDVTMRQDGLPERLPWSELPILTSPQLRSCGEWRMLSGILLNVWAVEADDGFGNVTTTYETHCGQRVLMSDEDSAYLEAPEGYLLRLERVKKDERPS